MTTTTGLPIWTIYENPSDYPGKFVVRLFLNDEPSTRVTVHDTLKQARVAVPPGLVCLPRFAADEPQIVEVWL